MKTSLCLLFISIFLFFSCTNNEEIAEQHKLNVTVEEGEILDLYLIKVENDQRFFLEAESNQLKENGVIDLPENGTYQILVKVDINDTMYGDFNIFEINEQKNTSVTLSPQDQVGSLKVFVKGNYSNKKLYAALIVEETPYIPNTSSIEDVMTNFINHSIIISDKINQDGAIIIENIPADSKNIDGYGNWVYLTSSVESAYCAIMVYDEDFTVNAFATVFNIKAHEEGFCNVLIQAVY
ncbi:hypothetical protein [Flammeovirga agarivorans]|uniref:Uncharacterized protein n=1 Tax=Flammeovirga agarivorans TaxID=2726742 RepID=A0A7X8SM81_9BACT|nr:hypothetical protein [Flammeovirga agarivorans]NLR92803.1 hypothetical protein [Flammeovirga agarivorans]